eukprot:scaffold1565_cov221-Amphora_coffeaeformis.AAC.11
MSNFAVSRFLMLAVHAKGVMYGRRLVVIGAWDDDDPLSVRDGWVLMAHEHLVDAREESFQQG